MELQPGLGASMPFSRETDPAHSAAPEEKETKLVSRMAGGIRLASNVRLL